MGKKNSIFLVGIVIICLFSLTACKTAVQSDLVNYSSSIHKVIDSYNSEIGELGKQSDDGYSKYIREKSIPKFTSLKKDAENIKIKTDEVKNLNKIFTDSLGEYIDLLKQLADAMDSKDANKMDEIVKKLTETDKKVSEFNTKYNEMVEKNKLSNLKLKS